ncbi:MAG: hypothetical protein OQL27_07770 [Sedimenticola sp.]|nr:hypothetical protein [Sedimenticola sp.]
MKPNINDQTLGFALLSPTYLLNATFADLNNNVDIDPKMINDAFYEAGWPLRLKDFYMKAYHGLLDAASYEDMTAGD